MRRAHSKLPRREPKPTAPQPTAPTGTLTTAPRAQYDAARQGRRLAGWQAPASGPNKALVGLETIRNRARDLVRNEWAGAAGSRVWTTNLIGTGIVPRPNTKDATLKAKLNTLWREWVSQADSYGLSDFYALQTLATRNWVASGEVFFRLRYRRAEDGMQVPLQVELLESDMCPNVDLDYAPGLPPGHKIRSGIEISRIGRRVAYWLYREHPGDLVSGTASLADLVRVPAESMRHLFEPLRPGQLRGVSDFASSMIKLKGVLDFDDAVLERQKIANLFTMFVTRGALGDGSIDPITGEVAQVDSDGAPMAALEPGLSQELLPGEDVRFSEPPDAGTNYADFMRQQHLGVAAGNGMPYELLTGDIKDVSDRTLRVILTEFRRHCEQRQWQIIIPMFCTPIRDAWADTAAIFGTLSAAEAQAAKDVTWQPQGWTYIHPVQDVQGKRLEVEAGFRSRSSVISERGDDPDLVDIERAADLERADALGLIPEPAEDPVAQAQAAKARAEGALYTAQERATDAAAADNRGLAAAKADEVRARAGTHAAEARRLEAQAAALTAEARHSEALASAAAAESRLAEHAAAHQRALESESADYERQHNEIRLVALQAEAERHRENAVNLEAHLAHLRELEAQAAANKVVASALEIDTLKLASAALGPALT